MAKTKIGDAELFYKVLGEGKDTIVFLNGIAMTSDSWKNQISFFAKDYRLLLHDFRGQLLSEETDDNLSMETHLEDLKNLLDHESVDKAHFISMGYGGEIGLMFAISFPERVQSLTVISACSQTNELIDRVLDSWICAAELSPVCYLKSTIPWNYSSEFMAKNPELMNIQFKIIEQVPSTFYPNFIRLCKALKGFNITNNLSKIKSPVLVITGEKDILTGPYFAKLIQSKVKKSRYALVKNSGHAVLFEKPEIVNKLIADFFNQQ